MLYKKQPNLKVSLQLSWNIKAITSNSKVFEIILIKYKSVFKERIFNLV